MVFRRFQGVSKCDIGLKWVNMTLSSILTMIINPDALEILPTGKTYFPKLSKFNFTFPGTLCTCSFSAWGGGGLG